jgi:hypothetical protein
MKYLIRWLHSEQRLGIDRIGRTVASAAECRELHRTIVAWIDKDGAEASEQARHGFS